MRPVWNVRQAPELVSKLKNRFQIHTPMIQTPCKCGSRARPGQRDCWKCHSRAQRRYRTRTRLSPEARRRINARSYAHVYIRRGKLTPGRCKMASRECLGRIQPHHENYARPLDVRWRCQWHHLRLHGKRMRRVPIRGLGRARLLRLMRRAMTTRRTLARGSEKTTHTTQPGSSYTLT